MPPLVPIYIKVFLFYTICTNVFLWKCGRVFETVHASFVESVPFRSIVIFTIFQIVYFLVCFGVTWIPVAGILFPVPFFLLISIRQHILPKLFQMNHLRELDAAEYEEIAGSPNQPPSFNLRVTFLKNAVALGCFFYLPRVKVRTYQMGQTGRLKVSQSVSDA